ncbi:hypothetical protein DID75_02800 [Candidatus Marinamargulisbacteria bacterium SCGC AG-410-N11]|nr:hypothetical protein DID75_02800 [Candidatus Marinamargulisbacteria bacterium SCGC AG-410-N11]
MTLVWVPGLIIFVLFLSATPDHSSVKPREVKKDNVNWVDFEHKITSSFSDSQKVDYNLIKSYIKDRYRKIKDQDITQISAYLVKFGNEMGIDPKITAALVARESSFNKEAVSVTGAKGLGQIKDFNFKALDISNPFDIKENIKGTTQYLTFLMDKWKKKNQKETQVSANNGLKVLSESEKLKLSLASYFKGFTNVVKSQGTPDLKTTGYVNDILKYYEELKLKSQKAVK